MALKTRQAMEEPRDNTRATCKMCDAPISFDQFSRHARLHHEEKQYKCTQCTQQSTRISDMRRHMILVHQSDEEPIDRISEDMKKAWAALRIQCFPQLENWMRKKPKKTKTCMNKEAECQICKAEVKSDRARHVRKHHDVQPYKCPFCPSSSSRADVIRRHIERIHGLKNKSAENHVTEEMREAWKKLLPICFPLMDVGQVAEEKEGDSGDESTEETTPNDRRKDDEKVRHQVKK